MRCDGTHFFRNESQAGMAGRGDLWRVSWQAISHLTVALLVVALSGCVIPRTGPMSRDFDRSSDDSNVTLVSVSGELFSSAQVAICDSYPPEFLSATAMDYEKLGPGDGVHVTIWERDGLGLFDTAAGGPTDLGELILDNAGAISIPYAGKVKAAGLSDSQLQDAIARHLKGLLIAPEVAVRTIDRQGKIVTLQGDLAKPGVYTIGPGSQRLSGLLALAAPDGQNAEQVSVVVRRGSQVGAVRLADIYADGTQDIAMRAGDTVIVHAVVENVLVLGATGFQGRVRLSKRRYSVMDALGDAHGLDDATANPRAVYLLRAQSAAGKAPGAPRPTIYQFDFRRPEQLVLASRFLVHDGDAIYVSDAPFTQVKKLLGVFGSSVSTVRAGADVLP
jgi:polysaccharide export outer membrane protein